MDRSPWVCGACGCQGIAFELAVCPQCDTPKAQQSAAAGKKTAAAKTGQE